MTLSLTIIRGISGSGKSTWAQSQKSDDTQIVSRDKIRLGLFDVEYDMGIEHLVTIVEHAMIEGFLKSGISVISDNTNVDLTYVRELANIGHWWDAKVSLKVFDVPLETAIKNNDHRAMLGGRFVPHHIIQRQWERFQETKEWKIDEA